MGCEPAGRSRREGGLRRRLLGAFLLLSLVPLFGSNAIGYLRTRSIVADLVTRYLDGMADLEGAHIEGRLEQRALYLSAIGNGNRFLEAAASPSSASASGMSSVASPEATTAYLRRKLDDSGHFGALALFSATGQLIASTHESHVVNERLADEPETVSLVRATDPTVPPTLRLTVPVNDDTGVPRGYLVATIPLDAAGEFLEIPRHVAGSIESFIVDGNGWPVFVSHPHGELRYDAPLESPLVGASDGSHAVYRDREGIEVIGASAPLVAYGWRFIAEIPTADALGELGDLRNLSLMLGSVFAVLVVAAGWILAGGIVAPVRRLVAAARALGSGDLDVRIPDPGRDEIGELSQAFNEMAAELTTHQRRLDAMHRREIERAQQLATVGELASGVAHEIKNPVVGISNGLDLVLRRVEDPELKPITNEMVRQLRRIEGAVRDLLTFARPTRPEVAPADLNEVVGRALTLVGPAAGKAGVHLESRLEHGLPEVQIDGELIRQAVVNLLMNAIHASPEGERIVVETDTHEGSVRVAIQDSGPGLSPEEQERVFKPFFTTRHSGTGLGLSISRGIVEQHGGRVEIESRPGEGARFIVSIPVGGGDTQGGDAP